MKKWFAFIALVFVVLVAVFLKPQKMAREEAVEMSPMNAEFLLAGVHSVPTQWPEKASFEVETRFDKLEVQNCKECHVGAKNKRAAKFANRRAHWKVHLQHAEAKTMRCNTCHSSTDVSQLKLLGGETVSMDHAYRTCRQCHFQQARDWAGGAHGKRVKTWAGRRIIYNCTGCHNPHKPKLEKRWPKINVTLPEGH